MDMRRILERRGLIRVIPYESIYKDQMIEIAMGIHGDSVYGDLPLDEAKLIRQLAACGDIVPDRYFRLAVREDEVLGGFYGHVRKTFFCDEILAHDLGWWVKPASRGGRAAILLLADFEKWAKEQGARKVMVGQSTGRNIEQTTKLYEHCGYRVIGFNTVKDL